MKRRLLSLLFTWLLITSAAFAQEYRQLTNLPSVYVNTYSGAGITSKENYIYARLVWVDEKGTAVYDSIQIRGRGNSTWGMAKKPYRIKLQKKKRLLGSDHAKARSWTLLANCADKAMIRNALASEVGAFLGLKFNPAAEFVDFYLNNKYKGTYQVSDQVDIRPQRVDIYEQVYQVTDNTTDVSGGYLLEATGNYDSDDPYITTSHNVLVRIHEPSDSIGNRQLKYIKNYIAGFENSLYSEKFGDAKLGYRRYVDSTSLFAWYLANEIAANPDGFYSTYFYKDRNDPALYFGPLWDNDISFNNTTRKGDVSQKLMIDVGYGDTMMKVWLTRMRQDEWFTKSVAQTYADAYNRGLTDFMIEKVDSLARLLEKSQEENYKVWNIRQRYYEEIKLFSTYDEYIDDLKTFIRDHNDYLKRAFRYISPFECDTASYYRIYNMNIANGLLDVCSASTIYNVPYVCLYMETAERLSQQWRILPVDDHYLFVNRESGLALADLTQTASSSHLTVAEPDPSDERQLWDIVRNPSTGYCNLANLATGRIAINKGGYSRNDNPIISFTGNQLDATSGNRLWYFEKAGPVESLPDAIRALPEEAEEYALMFHPAQQEVHFIAPDLGRLRFEARVFTLDGRRVGSFQADEAFSTRQLARGIYVVSWQYGGRTHSAKFEKK